MKALGTTKLKKAVRDMDPGVLVVDKRTNEIHAYCFTESGRIPSWMLDDIDFNIHMVYVKEPKKC